MIRKITPQKQELYVSFMLWLAQLTNNKRISRYKVEDFPLKTTFFRMKLII